MLKLQAHSGSNWNFETFRLQTRLGYSLSRVLICASAESISGRIQRDVSGSKICAA